MIGKIKEFCFGIIPLRRKGNDWQVLLVKHNKGHWGFPKGHPTPKELPPDIAKRELLEETGLSVAAFMPRPPLIETYAYTNGDKVINKSVMYFMAEVTGDVHLGREEVSDSKWLLLNEATDLITYQESKNICSKVEKIFNSSS